MPASITRPPGCLAAVLLKRCEVCGSPDAPFGVGASVLGAVRAMHRGGPYRVDRAKEALGLWYCPEHRPGGQAAGVP